MQRSTHQANQSEQPSNGAYAGSLFSPGFKSVVAMAGWDEEAILTASLVVDDTPERELKQKKRPELGLKTPPTYSRRKRRNQRQVSPIEAKILNLDEEEKVVKVARKEESVVVEEKIGQDTGGNDEKVDKKTRENSGRSSEVSSSSSNAGIPCMDRLREELSCAICLEICYEPSTTLCGHSFCRKCLKSAAEKCGKKCPKCRQLIGNGRSCPVNSVLWNTIQLLFPVEIESRKKASEGSMKSPVLGNRRNSNVRDRNGQSPTFLPVRVSTGSPVFYPIRVSNRSRERMGLNRDVGGERRRRLAAATARASQAEDAELALTLQREEFMEAFRVENEASLPVATARARAVPVRVRVGRSFTNLMP